MGLTECTQSEQRAGCDRYCNEQTFQKCGCLSTGGVTLESEEYNLNQGLNVPMGKVDNEAQKYLSQNDKNYMNACAGKNIAAIRYYIKLGAQVNTYDEDRSSNMHLACRTASFQLIEELVNLGTQLNIADQGGYTPLHIASRQGRGHVCYLLLKKGANPNTYTREGQTPGHLASNILTKIAFQTYSSQQKKWQTNPKTVPQKVRNFRKDIEIDLQLHQLNKDSAKTVIVKDKKYTDRKFPIKKRNSNPKKHSYYKIFKELVKTENRRIEDIISENKETTNQQQRPLKRQFTNNSLATIVQLNSPQHRRTHSIQLAEKIIKEFQLYDKIGDSDYESDNSSDDNEEDFSMRHSEAMNSSQESSICPSPRDRKYKNEESWLKETDLSDNSAFSTGKYSKHPLQQSAKYEYIHANPLGKEDESFTPKVKDLNINFPNLPRHTPLLPLSQYPKQFSVGIQVRILDLIHRETNGAKVKEVIREPRDFVKTTTRGKSRGKSKGRPKQSKYIKGHPIEIEFPEEIQEEMVDKDKSNNSPLNFPLPAPSSPQGGTSPLAPKTHSLESFGPLKPHKNAAEKRRISLRKSLGTRQTYLSTIQVNHEPDGPRADYIGNQNLSILKMGTQLFNLNYTLGVSFLVNTGYLDESVNSLVEFIFDSEDILKSVIGYILSDIEYKDHTQLLDLYMSKFIFQGIHFIDALRLVFEQFIVPYHIPSLHIITQVFAKYYFASNPITGIQNEEAMHHLSFSTLLIDFERYKSTKYPLSKVDYLSLNYGLNDGENFNRKFLEGIHEVITQNPIIPFEILGNEAKLLEEIKVQIFAQKMGAHLYKRNGHGIRNGEILYEKGMLYIFQNTENTDWPSAFFFMDDLFSIKIDQKRKVIAMNKRGRTFPYAKIKFKAFNKIEMIFLKEFTFGLRNESDFRKLVALIEFRLPK